MEAQGLGVVLQPEKSSEDKSNQFIITQIHVMKPTFSSSSSPSNSIFYYSTNTNTSNNNLTSYRLSSFLDKCFLCGKKLLSKYNIYMYKGEEAFCSKECRYRQIELEGFLAKDGDEELAPLTAAGAATPVTAPFSSRSNRRNGGPPNQKYR